MTTAYWSTVFERSADEVWAAIRAFDDYGWAGPGLTATMEGGRSGDAVGGIRRIETPGGAMRQQLLAHSDVGRSFTFTILPPSPHPFEDYVSTLRVTPVVDGDRAFIEWSATFEAPDGDRATWRRTLATWYEGWLESLRATL